MINVCVAAVGRREKKDKIGCSEEAAVSPLITTSERRPPKYSRHRNAPAEKKSKVLPLEAGGEKLFISKKKKKKKASPGAVSNISSGSNLST